MEKGAFLGGKWQSCLHGAYELIYALTLAAVKCMSGETGCTCDIDAGPPWTLQFERDCFS